MFIQTEATPNPARLKFLPGCEVLAEGTLDLRDKTQAADSPLAERLFAIPGIASVSFCMDSITVTNTGATGSISSRRSSVRSSNISCRRRPCCAGGGRR